MLDDDLDCSSNNVITLQDLFILSLSYYKLSLILIHFSLSFLHLCVQTSHNRERSKSVSRLIESENHDYPVQRYKQSYVTSAIFMDCQARTERVKVLFKDDRTQNFKQCTVTSQIILL